MLIWFSVFGREHFANLSQFAKMWVWGSEEPLSTQGNRPPRGRVFSCDMQKRCTCSLSRFGVGIKCLGFFSRGYKSPRCMRFYGKVVKSPVVKIGASKSERRTVSKIWTWPFDTPDDEEHEFLLFDHNSAACLFTPIKCEMETCPKFGAKKWFLTFFLVLRVDFRHRRPDFSIPRELGYPTWLQYDTSA